MIISELFITYDLFMTVSFELEVSELVSVFAPAANRSHEWLAAGSTAVGYSCPFYVVAFC